MLMNSLKKVVAAAGLSLCAMTTQAALVTLDGTTVTYTYDDSQAAIALFGTPTIIGDVVRFMPPNFRAESLDGAGTNSTTANFIFTSVKSKNGEDLASVSVLEFGDYEITNGDAVSADLLLTASSNFYPFEYTYASDSFDATGGTTGLQTWTMTAMLDPATAFVLPANDVSLSIQNTLTATTDANGEVAWIAKKLAFVASTAPDVLPPEVPIPAAAWLFGSALLGLIGVGRRKRAQA